MHSVLSLDARYQREFQLAARRLVARSLFYPAFSIIANDALCFSTICCVTSNSFTFF